MVYNNSESKTADQPKTNKMEITTKTQKNPYYGWIAKTLIKDVKGFDWEITTMKRHNGSLSCSAQGGKMETEKGYYTFSFTVFESPLYHLAENKNRCTEKNVYELHKLGIEKFKEIITGLE